MELKDIPLYKKMKAVRRHDNKVVRFEKEKDNMIFVYGKYRKNYGWRITEESFLQNYIIKETRSTDKSKWEHNVNRVIKTLEKSGLWADILETYKNLKILGYDEKNRIYDEYNKIENEHEWKDGKCYNTVEYDNWLSGLEAKYPFLIGCDEENRKYLKTSYIWELSRATLKPMYFGKWNNTEEKGVIARRIADKKNYRCFHTVSYDVSFEYNAKLGKAWYSEEYRGCGNGHYYLALDNNLALFCEND